MSFGSIPAALSAAITFRISAPFSASAPAAVLLFDSTPKLKWARSGVTDTLPLPETEIERETGSAAGAASERPTPATAATARARAAIPPTRAILARFIGGSLARLPSVRRRGVSRHLEGNEARWYGRRGRT